MSAAGVDARADGLRGPRRLRRRMPRPSSARASGRETGSSRRSHPRSTGGCAGVDRDAGAIDFMDADAVYARHGPMFRDLIGVWRRHGTPGRAVCASWPSRPRAPVAR